MTRVRTVLCFGDSNTYGAVPTLARAGRHRFAPGSALAGHPAAAARERLGGHRRGAAEPHDGARRSDRGRVTRTDSGRCPSASNRTCRSISSSSCSGPTTSSIASPPLPAISLIPLKFWSRRFSGARRVRRAPSRRSWSSRRRRCRRSTGSPRCSSEGRRSRCNSAPGLPRWRAGAGPRSSMRETVVESSTVDGIHLDSDAHRALGMALAKAVQGRFSGRAGSEAEHARGLASS